MESIDTVKRLETEFNENINSHVFLLETNNIEECLKDVKKLCRKIIDTDDEIVHRQLDEETYLEMIIVRPEGKEIKKDQILSLQERIKTKPVLSDKLIYVIVPAEAMNDISANKLLKTIEEPNKHVIGFLISSNSDLLLPTVKSRCEILSMMYETHIKYDEIEESTIKLASKLVESIEEKDHVKFSKIIREDKNLKENAKIVENLIKDYYNTACNLSKTDILDSETVEKIRKNNSNSTLIRKTKYINKILNKLTKNMNTELLLEKMFLDLKEVK